MDARSFSRSALGRSFIRALAAVVESPLRYRLFGPQKILQGVPLAPGETVLEVGCGTGFFTLPAARLLGAHGRLIAIDILRQAVELVSCKTRAAGAGTVCVAQASALALGFSAQCFDLVLLFGVIPSPMLPLARLLPEMHRLLKADGILAVWPPVPGWLPRSILDSTLFTLSSRQNGVHNFQRI
jgi:ubiquinone/menaquinone biosynthesis C-methylase UbiE